MAIAFVTGGPGFVGRNLIVALRARGDEVRALARSDKSIATVQQLGAKGVKGDLDDVAAMTAGMSGAQIVFHAAAQTDMSGSRAEFFRGTVAGTENVLIAARAAKVRRFVHVSTVAVLADGKPIVRADETRPRAKNPAGNYPWSKGLAEERVLAANRDGLETVIIRPRFVWGKGAASVVRNDTAAVTQGRFKWSNGGHYLTSTCHIANVIEGALLEAEKGKAGEIYFLTDGEPVELRPFLRSMLATRGVDGGTSEIPLWLVRVAAKVTGFFGKPLMSPDELALFAVEVTVVDAKARRELGYRGAMTQERGFAEMRSDRN